MRARVAAAALVAVLAGTAGCDDGGTAAPSTAPSVPPEAGPSITSPASAVAAEQARALVGDLVDRVPADTVVEQADLGDGTEPCQESSGGPAGTRSVVSTRLHLTPGADYEDVVERLRRGLVTEGWAVRGEPRPGQLRWTLVRRGWTVSIGAAPGRGDVGPQMVVDAASPCRSGRPGTGG